MKYIVEYANGCCFEHCSDTELVFSSKKEALKKIEQLKSLTVKDMREKNIWISIIRLRQLDITIETILDLELEYYLYNYEDNEKITWIITQ